MIKSKYTTDTLSPKEMKEQIHQDWLKYSDDNFYKGLNPCDLNDHERAYKFGAYRAMYGVLYDKIETLNHILNFKK